ncbi:hypothetical protein F5Y16DRAFT_361104 [Xylariaceae sp. FL0255]|nr:hypothetical protein F5Y16DRAFT_361104 [Xylariaceae sp. FL0255]
MSTESSHSQPQEHSKFSVSSSCLCYGALHNIFHGASSPVQTFSARVEGRTGGTVISQILYFNIAAENGTWIAYQLNDNLTNQVCGWFVCHSDIDPSSEIDKILNVAGSPYEGGENSNTENTAAEGVFVINRYDWGHYDSRAREDVPNWEDDGALYEAAGLVDLATAKEAVLKWNEDRSAERQPLPDGVWMCIPGGEYMFGRFGFNEDRSAARSFLFFTTNTVFNRTTFAGQKRTLRQGSTEGDESQATQVASFSGSDPEGFERLQKRLQWSNSKIPSESDMLGPYAKSDFILQESDIEAIRVRPGVSAAEFLDRSKEACYHLLNEMCMSYLEYFIAPNSSYEDVATAAEHLYPKHENSRTVDECMFGFMIDPHSDPVVGYDARAIGDRIKKFLTPKCSDNSLIRDQKFVDGLSAGLLYLLSEILELTDQYRRDTSTVRLQVSGIRLSTVGDSELLEAFKYSRVFWKREEAAAVAEP